MLEPVGRKAVQHEKHTNSYKEDTAVTGHCYALLEIILQATLSQHIRQQTHHCSLTSINLFEATELK